MRDFEIVACADDREVAEKTAQQWLAQLAATRQSATPYCVALSGGRIAQRFFSELVAQSRHKGIGFENVHFFWADERCVPADDSESNFGIAQRLLFAPLALPEGQIHRIHGEKTPETAAQEAAATLCGIAPARDGQPVLDIVFLGMGEDGHVASLFPGEREELAMSTQVYRPVIAVKPPPQRVTLGYPALIAAQGAWILASGPGKERALRASLAPEAKTPLGRLLRLRKRCRIFTDLQAR